MFFTMSKYFSTTSLLLYILNISSLFLFRLEIIKILPALLSRSTNSFYFHLSLYRGFSPLHFLDHYPHMHIDRTHSTYFLNILFIFHDRKNVHPLSSLSFHKENSSFLPKLQNLFSSYIPFFIFYSEKNPPPIMNVILSIPRSFMPVLKIRYKINFLLIDLENLT